MFGSTVQAMSLTAHPIMACKTLNPKPKTLGFRVRSNLSRPPESLTLPSRAAGSGSPRAESRRFASISITITIIIIISSSSSSIIAIIIVIIVIAIYMY